MDLKPREGFREKASTAQSRKRERDISETLYDMLFKSKQKKIY